MRNPVRADLRNVGVLLVVLALAPIPVIGSTYYEGVLAHMAIIALFAVGLNIVFGHTDQLFLFMGGLGGIGAYGTALLSNWLGVTAWVTLPVAVLVAGLIGLAVSWVSAKRNFTVVLISILTLNLQLVFVEAFVGARDITKGTTGFPYRYFSLSGAAEVTGLSEDAVLYYLIVLLLIVALLNGHLVHRRPFLKLVEFFSALSGIDRRSLSRLNATRTNTVMNMMSVLAAMSLIGSRTTAVPMIAPLTSKAGTGAPPDVT